MLKVEFDKSKNLLWVVLSERVTTKDTGRWREQLEQLLPGLKHGFKLLADFSPMDSMDFDCAPDIGRSMEALDKAGLSRVVRIMPDPRKDIGLNIISLFHSRRSVSVVTCATMEEALNALAD